MPLSVVRNDIALMEADAIVNSTNPLLQCEGSGVDAALHKAAGPEMQADCDKHGYCPVGFERVTPGHGLNCKYVIHAVAPYDRHDPDAMDELRETYRNCLLQAYLYNCESIAMPVLGTGAYDFPKGEALQTAIDAAEDFLEDYDMDIYIVVYNEELFNISGRLFDDIEEFIDDNYIDENDEMLEEFADRLEDARYSFDAEPCAGALPSVHSLYCNASEAPHVPDIFDIDLDEVDAQKSFSETLIAMIADKYDKDSDFYRKANIDRKLFSKIRKPDYKPTRETAFACAIGLELNPEEAKELLATAGITFARNSKTDVIVAYFIKNGMYNIHELNIVLDSYGLAPLGSFCREDR